MKKNSKRGYQPRHVISDDAPAAQAASQQTYGGRYREEKSRNAAEFSEELRPVREPVTRRNTAAASAEAAPAPAAKPEQKAVPAARAEQKAVPAAQTEQKVASAARTEQKPTASPRTTQDPAPAAKASAPEPEKEKAAVKAEKHKTDIPQESKAVARDSKPSDEEKARAKDSAVNTEPEKTPKNASPAPSDGDDPLKAAAVSAEPVVEAQDAAPEEPSEETDNSEQESADGKKGKKKRWKRVLIIAVSIPLAIIIALVGTFFIMRESGRQSLHSNKHVEMVLPTLDESGNEINTGDLYGRIINYNGKSYVYNNDIVTLTFIGVDRGHGEDKSLKMADAIYLFAFDTNTDKLKVLNISRDIITDVDVYSLNGNFIGTEETQIAFSNAYEGQGVTGGENTVKSVSRLLFSLPLENYFELDLGGLTTLNDAVGGVTVTSALTFTSPEDGRTIREGEIVTLHGKEAEYYARRRDITQLDSNNDRMKRQQDYIMAFLSSIVPAAKKNLSIIPNLYSAIVDNSKTSLNASEVVYLASYAVSNLKSLSDIEFYKFNGTITAGKNAEMHVKTEEIMNKLLDIFYKPIETSATDADGNPISITVPTIQPTQPAETALPTEQPTEKPKETVQPTESSTAD